ncbi:bem46 protein, variant, partial [Basidiobolus ranarum]
VARNEDKISALMIENTFLSIPKLIPHIFPFFGYFTFLCHQKWKTEDIISDIQKTPILFLSGVRDEIVPPQHMKILHAKTLTTGGKYFNEFNAQHNDTCLSAGYFEVIDDFWARCINKTARNPQLTSQ